MSLQKVNFKSGFAWLFLVMFALAAGLAAPAFDMSIKAIIKDCGGASFHLLNFICIFIIQSIAKARN